MNESLTSREFRKGFNWKWNFAKIAIVGDGGSSPVI